jgi:hypothetical protein
MFLSFVLSREISKMLSYFLFMLARWNVTESRNNSGLLRILFKKIIITEFSKIVDLLTFTLNTKCETNYYISRKVFIIGDFTFESMNDCQVFWLIFAFPIPLLQYFIHVSSLFIRISEKQNWINVVSLSFFLLFFGTIPSHIIYTGTFKKQIFKNYKSHFKFNRI